MRVYYLSTLTYFIIKDICPGRYLAENTIFLAVCCILKLFNVSHAKDASGAEIPIDVRFTSVFCLSQTFFYYSHCM
jgi:hypothetical protein